VSRIVGIVLLAALAGLWSGRASADRQLGVGLCVPEIPFASARARHRAAKRVAQHLSRSLRRPVEGFAYLKPEDLRRDVRAGRLHFAVVGALFAATVPDNQILAQGRLSKNTAGVWSILCRDQRTLQQLRGKRLQIPRMGPGTLAFVQDGVAGGAVNVKGHFKVQWSPNLLSAQAAVRLGHADAVVAPLSTTGLVSVLQGYPLPPPAFVLVDRQVPTKTVELARGALQSLKVGVSAVQSWHKPEAGAYRKLAAFTGRQQLRMVLVPVVGTPLDVDDLLRREVLLPGMPALDEPFGVR
jgi:hypothetical protein